MTKFFDLLCRICVKRGYFPPTSEEMVVTNSAALDYYIDDVLAQELVLCGFGANDEPNQYGMKIEETIDYFNRFRL